MFATCIVTIALVAPAFIFSQDRGEILLRRGISQFGETAYDDSIRAFRDIILDSDLTGYHDEAYFWIAKSYIALGQYDEAEKNLEFFISEFPDSPSLPESLYQRGRLLFLRNEYDAAILALESYISSFPSSAFVANSFFWIGEALYGLGQFDRARSIFTVVVGEYPSSFKVEAARYRISLIDLKEREAELLKLIKWSHEEYLQALEDFQRRERSYEQALAAYQRRIADLTSSSKEQEIANLTSQVEELSASVEEYRTEAERLQSQLDRLLSGSFSSQSSSGSVELLELRSELLEIKSDYLEKLVNDE